MNPARPDGERDPMPAPDGSLLGPKGDPVEGPRRNADDEDEDTSPRTGPPPGPLA